MKKTDEEVLDELSSKVKDFGLILNKYQAGLDISPKDEEYLIELERALEGVSLSIKRAKITLLNDVSSIRDLIKERLVSGQFDSDEIDDQLDVMNDLNNTLKDLKGE